MVRYPNNVDEWPEIKMYSSDFRQQLLNMANVITKYELWEWLEKFNPGEGGFMFSTDDNVMKIGMALNDGHSGASFAIAFRYMEKIAKEGFDKLIAN